MLSKHRRTNMPLCFVNFCYKQPAIIMTTYRPKTSLFSNFCLFINLYKPRPAEAISDANYQKQALHRQKHEEPGESRLESIKSEFTFVSR
jgi:hypothetical protein